MEAVKATTARQLIIGVAFSTLCLQASGGVIGIAVSNGQMQVDRATVTGNANLNDGSSVQAAAEAARIQLNNGNRVTLAPDSAAQVYADRLVLQRGLGVVGSPGYRVLALGIEIVPESAASRAQVRVSGATVQVAAVNGPLKVTGGNGIVLAKVYAGGAMEVTPPAAGSAPTSTVTGTLRQESGKFMLRDEISNLDVELRGSGLTGQVGRNVQATGRASVSANKESQVIEVARLMLAKAAEEQSGGARPTTGEQGDRKKRPAAAPTGGGAAKTGMSAGAKVGIIAAIGGGAAGLALGLSGSDSKSVSR